jgi:hypothetical protein
MNAITSIYIPCIDTGFNAKFIADVFDRNGIAHVSRVYIEPTLLKSKNGLSRWNRAYIDINYWHDTEAAYNFIYRLRSLNREARIVYDEDNWWPVEINKNPSKLASIKRVLTIFEDNRADFCDDNVSTTLVRDEPEEFVHIDAEKTALLRSIVANFKNQTKDNDLSSFDSYIREMDNDREKWFSEQYIYDTLLM